MDRRFDVIIAGGGIVGLATAYTMLKRDSGLRLLLIEKEAGVSRHQTGNNSGVIHSGIYYKPGSLKATNCIKGYKMLLNFCDENDVPYDICGKVIVATDETEIPAMMTLYERGNENGLDGLKILRETELTELKELEPYVTGVKGIFVPQTGIIDYKVVSNKIYENILMLGGKVIFEERLTMIKEHDDSVEIRTNKNYYTANKLITCCGLQADKAAGLNNRNLRIRIIPFRGEYYKIKKEKSYHVKNLIYPVPDPNFPFLGVHYTRKKNGEIEAGPNAVFAFKREGYKKFDVDFGDLINSLSWRGFQRVAGKFMKTGLMEYYRSFSKPAFTRALQKLTPTITERDLEEGGAGVRAQACDIDGKLVDDFLFIENKNVLHVCNAPSPAATSCLAIGEVIAERMKYTE